jgi:hypothetical protein
MGTRAAIGPRTRHYRHTAFEFITDWLEAQGTVLLAAGTMG